MFFKAAKPLKYIHDKKKGKIEKNWGEEFEGS